MGRSANPGLAAFMGVAMFLVAWKLAPEPDSHGMLWVVSGAFAVCGTLLMIQWLQSAEKRPSPWSGALGQILWLLRPRSWMIAWAAMLFAGKIYGTPHVLYQYPNGRNPERCVYVGISGTKVVAPHGGSMNGCRLAALLT